MADGTNTKSWQKFVAELKKEGMDFADIQHADEKTRAQLLEAMPSLSPLDRASISSTWKRLADKPAEVSTPSRDAQPPAPTPAPRAGARGPPPPQQQQQQRQAPQYANPNSQARFDAVQDYVPPQLMRSPGSNVAPRVAPPVLSVPVMNVGVGGNDLASLLRTALDRGDCGTALPLASEMLQTDPIGLCHMLNEFLPQLSVEQLKTILGVGMPLGQEGGTPSQTFSPANGSPKGQMSPRAGVSPRAGGSMQRQPSPNRTSMSNFYAQDNSPGVEMSVQPTINGQPLTAGQVLTQHSMQSQYGPRFTATCNGRTVVFPYCVQRGDRIVVRSAGQGGML